MALLAVGRRRSGGAQVALLRHPEAGGLGAEQMQPGAHRVGHCEAGVGRDRPVDGGDRVGAVALQLGERRFVGGTADVGSAGQGKAMAVGECHREYLLEKQGCEPSSSAMAEQHRVRPAAADPIGFDADVPESVIRELGQVVAGVVLQGVAAQEGREEPVRESRRTCHWGVPLDGGAERF